MYDKELHSSAGTKRLHTKRSSQVAFPSKNTTGEPGFKNYHSQKRWSLNCSTQMLISWLREAVVLNSYFFTTFSCSVQEQCLPCFLKGSVPIENG